jgi:hypothetical protein
MVQSIWPSRVAAALPVFVLSLAPAAGQQADIQALAKATRLTTSTFDIMKTDPKAGRAEAVRRGMLAYMNDRSDFWSGCPAFWGPFSVVGEGGAR